MAKLARALALESIVRGVAREVIVPRFLHITRERKLDGSSLTEADLASQRALCERLPDLLDAPIIGEEMTDAEQQAHWAEGKSGLWCIDPIDGTTNFSNGIPVFAVSVAYLVDGVTEFGVVYNPVRDEAFYAERGAGAWLNGTRLPLRAPATTLDDAVAGIDFKRVEPALAAHLVRTPPYYSQRNFGSSALEWCFVAAGRLDVYLHGGQALWDYAAGRLVLEEAGGVHGVLGGGPLIADPARKSTVVLAADLPLYQQWQAWLQQHR
ncbi:MAG: inositol monophosphatase family protein [Rhodocyclaceae bacterium]